MFIIYKVVKYRKILLIYNVYFIFSLVKIYNLIFSLHRSVHIIFWITSDFSIDLLQCTSELQTPITFLFVNETSSVGMHFLS